ncbi:MAG: hypothetical protein ACREP9_04030 [Candidatus Dormibacteraceae bacterium]
MSFRVVTTGPGNVSHDPLDYEYEAQCGDTEIWIKGDTNFTLGSGLARNPDTYPIESGEVFKSYLEPGDVIHLHGEFPDNGPVHILVRSERSHH